MSVIFIVLPLALLVAFIAVIGYVWSARSGQLDDLDTPAMRMLHDDDATAPISGRVGSADNANSRK